MKKTSVVLSFLIMAGCSPVLERQFTDEAFLNVPLASMTEYPLLYKADIYLLGGLIIETRESERGLLLEAVYIPVNRRGYLKDQKLTEGTYLALLPGNGPGIDELTYRPGTYITIAAEFIGNQAGIKSRGTYPLFEVKDLHVWGDEYIEAFDLSPGKTGPRLEERPVEPSPIWENPVSP